MKLWARRGFEWAEEGLTGLWCPVLTGGTGSTLLDCNQSTSNHGALTNYSNLNTAWIGSQYGTVLDFDNTDDNVSISHLSALDSGDHTISFWYFTSTVSGLNQIIAQWPSVGGSGPIIFRNGAAIAWQIVNRVTTSNILTANSWHFISCVRGTSLRVICNGVLDSGSTTPGTQSNSEPFLIGGPVGGAGTGAGNCRIAELQIHRRAITINEHQQAFQAGPGGAWQLTPPSRRYATILANAYTLIAASASYSITGQPVGLLAGRLLAADAASYLIAGNATGLNAGRLLTADSAAYALNGQDANLLASRLLSGDTATYNLIGNSANLLASRTLQADSAQYTVTGSDAALLAGRLLDCGSSAFLLSPNQAGLLAARKLTADQASILLTTQATNLYAGRKITADTAQFILIASPVDLTFGGGGAAPYYYLFLLGGSR